MISTRKKGLAYWLRRVALVLASAILTLCIAGLLYQAGATALDKRRFPPPGRLVDVGGYRLHIHCTGAGSPTVILEAGLGGASTIWARLQPEIAEVTQVCSYDRAGAGWSDPGPRPRDASHIASELHALLEAAGIPGPYVLVGHSYGGLYVRAFAGEYPESVRGMVLLESSHPDQYSRTPQAEDQFKLLRQMYDFTPAAVRLGLMRLGPFCRMPADYPAEAAAQFHAVCSSTDDWDTERLEVQAIPGTMVQVREAGSLGDLPLMVVSAGGNLKANPLWPEYQKELAALSTDSVQIVIEGAGHTSVWFDPEDAQVSTRVILLVIEAVRTGRRLESIAAPAGP